MPKTKVKSKGKAKRGKRRKPLGKGAKAFLTLLAMIAVTMAVYVAYEKIRRDLALAKTLEVPVDMEIDAGGTKLGAFKEPWGATTDGAGNIYVTDFSGQSVRKFDVSGKEVLSFGEPGKGPSQFNQPSGIFVDKTGQIYVCDTFNHRIQKFDSNGKYIKEWSHSFAGPKGIGGDESRIYVVDTGNHKIQMFDTEGKFIKEWGSFGRENGKFQEPEGCVVDPAGYIYVADSDNLRIQKFDLNGKFLAAFNIPTWRGKNDEMPYLALSQGVLYASNGSEKAVLKYTLSGNLLGIYKKQGTGFQGAAGVAVDNQGRVIVVERGIGKVARFAIPPPRIGR